MSKDENKNKTKVRESSIRQREKRNRSFSQNRSFEETDEPIPDKSNIKIISKSNPELQVTFPFPRTPIPTTSKLAKSVTKLTTPCSIVVKPLDLRRALGKLTVENNSTQSQIKISEETLQQVVDPPKDSLINPNDIKTEDSEDSEHSEHSDHSKHSLHRDNSFHSLPSTHSTDSEMVNETLQLKDIISAIPVFEGYQRDLDYFISVCTTYNDLVEETQRPMFISIIKSKLKGIALAKMQPVSTLTTWAEVKSRLEEKFKRPNTYENAQLEISNITQARNETVETYGNRLRMALIRLNSAAEGLTNTQEGKKSLRDANEKIAVMRFEQNLLSNDLKMWVGTKYCTTLDAAITHAMQKENHYKSNRKVTCNFCNREGHVEKECRQKQKNYNQGYQNRNQNRFNGSNGNVNNGNNNQARYRSSSYSPPKNNTSNNCNERKKFYPNRNNNDRYQNESGKYLYNNNYSHNSSGNNSNRPTNMNNNRYSNQNSNGSNPSTSQNARTTRIEPNQRLTLNDVLKKETKN